MLSTASKLNKTESKSGALWITLIYQPFIIRVTTVDFLRIYRKFQNATFHREYSVKNKLLFFLIMSPKMNLLKKSNYLRS